MPEPVGIGKYTGELALWLASRDCEVRVIAAHPYFPSWQLGNGNQHIRNKYCTELVAGVEVRRCPLWVPRRPGGLTRLVHLASFALSSLPALLSQRRWRPDVVITIAPAFFCAPGALLLGRLCGRGTVNWLHIQDFELDAAFELGMLKGKAIRGLAERWERATLRGFDRVSSISGAMVRRTVEKGVGAKRAVLLANWVDLEAIRPRDSHERESNPYRRELAIGGQQRVLMYSGSMNKKQGLELLVAVIWELQDVEDLLWLLAGEGPTRGALAQAVGGMRQVRLLPLQPMERLNDWLNLADVHLLPQRAGAADLVLPSKLLGILASGRPVVAGSPAGSELGDVAEVAGLRVEPEDPVAFAEAIRRLLEEPGLAEAQGRAGRRLVEERYGKEAVLLGLDKELETLRQGTGPQRR